MVSVYDCNTLDSTTTTTKMKSLDHQILTNLLNELNICKAKRSILLNSGLVPSILESRIEYLEREIFEQRKKCQHSD